jgi:Tol biopolymer transport system component
MSDSPATRPGWSPDGKKIAFDSQGDDNRDVFVVDVDGKFTRRLTHDDAVDRDPSWSRDGRWIYFSSSRNGKYHIWKVPSEGGAAVQVTRNEGRFAQESEDGFLYFVVRRQLASYKWVDIWRVPVAGGKETPVLEGQLLEQRNWVLWNHNMVFRPRLGIGSGCSIDIMDLDTFEVRQIADLGPQRGYGGGIAISPDGRSILVSKNRPSNSDITLVENFR